MLRQRDPSTRTAVRSPRSAVRLLVAALATASFLQWTGASAVLPLLPLYLQRRGSSAALIGAVMAAYFAGAVVAQYLAGRLGDRIGHRTVLVAGLLGYAVASAGFLADLGGTGYLVLRAGQGAAAGAAQVAMLALVASAVPATAHGRAFSAVYGAELAGVAIGPLVGTLVGVGGMGRLFVIAATAAALACLPVLLAGRRTTHLEDAADAAAEQQAAAPRPRPRLDRSGPRGRALIGVMLAAVVGGVLTGVYEACWTLLLDHRGAQPWQIGASWTLFAIPFVVASPVAGWLADHHDKRVLVVVSLVGSLAFASLYPFLSNLTWLIALGAVESVGVAVATPAAQAMLASAAPAEVSGRAMGLFASIQTAAIAVSAGVAGTLFGFGPWVPFVTASTLGAVLTVGVAVIWRGVPGRSRALA